MTTKTIELQNVRKFWPGVRALDNVTFEVQKGSIHGFLGPNGAGKSTTMNIITGLIPPTSGRVLINGHDSSIRGVSAGIGYLPERPPLYDSMETAKYLKFVAAINGLDYREVSNRVNAMIECCGLESVRRRLIGNLSKGYRQRVGLAQALIHNPQILILDEPTVGLDPNAVVEIRQLIKSLASGRTILFSSHILHEVDLICDEITIINEGKIIQSGNKDEISRIYQEACIIVATVEKWNDELLTSMRLATGLEKIVAERFGEVYKVSFYIEKDRDLRNEISRHLVELNAGLLSMMEEKPGLEEIFRKMTEH